MDATKQLSGPYGELEKQYGSALRIWSEARGLYPPDSPEVLSATALVEEFEEKLSGYSRALVPFKPGALQPKAETPLKADEKP